MPMPKRWESPPERVATCKGSATCLPWSTSKCSSSVLVFSSKRFLVSVALPMNLYNNATPLPRMTSEMMMMTKVFMESSIEAFLLMFLDDLVIFYTKSEKSL